MKQCGYVFEIAPDVVHHREYAVINELAIFLEIFQQEPVLTHYLDAGKTEKYIESYSYNKLVEIPSTCATNMFLLKKKCKGNKNLYILVVASLIFIIMKLCLNQVVSETARIRIKNPLHIPKTPCIIYIMGEILIFEIFLL